MLKKFIPLTFFIAVSALLLPESPLEGTQPDWANLAARCHEICQGPQGGIGPEGFPGTVGSTGPQGAQGEVGAQGQVGARGATGPTGGQGILGAHGPAGPNGPRGLTGFTGPAGAIGSTGAIGPQGTPGGPGVNGSLLGFAWAINPLVQSDIDPGEIVVLSGFISQSGGYSVSPEGGVIVPDSGDYQIFFGVLPDNAPSSIRLEINGFYMFPSAFSTRGGNDFVTGHVIVTLAKGDIVTIVSNSVTDPFGTALGDNETRPSTPTSMTILQLTSTSETAAQECCNLLFGTDTP